MKEKSLCLILLTRHSMTLYFWKKCLYLGGRQGVSEAWPVKAYVYVCKVLGRKSCVCVRMCMPVSVWYSRILGIENVFKECYNEVCKRNKGWSVWWSKLWGIHWSEVLAEVMVHWLCGKYMTCWMFRIVWKFSELTHGKCPVYINRCSKYYYYHYYGCEV